MVYITKGSEDPRRRAKTPGLVQAVQIVQAVQNVYESPHGNPNDGLNFLNNLNYLNGSEATNKGVSHGET